MPNNKSLDGIKKLSEQDLKKARDVVLQSIGEKSKIAKPVSSINNEEADKIEAATEKFKPKHVDGLVVSQKTSPPQSRPGGTEAGENSLHRSALPGRGKQTADNGHVFVSADFEVVADRSVQDKEKLEKAKAEQLKLKRQRMREKKEMGERQRLKQIKQERLNQEKIKEKQKLEEVEQKEKKDRQAKQKNLFRGKAGKKTKEQKKVNQEKKAKQQNQKQVKFYSDKSKIYTQPRLLVTCYLLLILTLIIIVACVGFFTIWYDLNNYAVLAKANKVKQMMESGANFYQIAKSQGDEFGVGKYYTYNEAIVKFGQNIVNLEIGQISIIKHTDSGYYLIQCYGRREKLIGFKYIFIKSRSLNDHVSEMITGLRVW